MQITRGVIKGAQKVVIYGPEGIGKSSLAAMFPNPVFIDVEGSTAEMDIARTPKPSSWTMVMEQIKYYKRHSQELGTLIIDTADWAERLCKVQICADNQKQSIEDFGYGKGYVHLSEEFGKLLNESSDLIELGINVVFTAHAQMRKFEQPDEMGAYDRWEMKLEKKTAPLLKEWASMVLFVNYKTYVINKDGKGSEKGTNKAQGGKRVIYTQHHPCWDAKNRHGLPEELSFNSPEDGWKQIAHCIPARESKPTPQPVSKPEQSPMAQELDEAEPVKTESPKQEPPKNSLDGVPKPLADLMAKDGATVEEVQKAVASRGYYPLDTPISNYDSNFINGVLVGAWDQVFEMITASRK